MHSYACKLNEEASTLCSKVKCPSRCGGFRSVNSLSSPVLCLQACVRDDILNQLRVRRRRDCLRFNLLKHSEIFYKQKNAFLFLKLRVLIIMRRDGATTQGALQFYLLQFCSLIFIINTLQTTSVEILVLRLEHEKKF